MRSRSSVVFTLALAACGSPAGSRDGGPAPGDGGAAPVYLEQLLTPSDFARVQGEGGEVKYLGAVAGRNVPAVINKPCLFQNTARYPLHVNFLRTFPELAQLDFDSYLSLVLKGKTRVLWGGALKLLPSAVHPRTGARGVLLYFLYADDTEDDALTVDEIAEVDARLKRCVPYAKDILVLVGMDAPQAARFEAQREALRGRNVDLVDLRTLRLGVGATGYSVGEAYGFLRVIPPGQPVVDYGPRDVVVAESAPEDLSLVAGLVTSLPQTLNSHVVLRLGEKKIPDASIPDIFSNQAVALLDGQLVHLTVSTNEVQLDPALLPAAEAFWASHRPTAHIPTADLSQKALRPLADLRVKDVVAFGGKASSLGEIAQALPPAARVDGFGIPFAAYADFMAATGLAGRVESLLADPTIAADARARRVALERLRDDIEAAMVPPALLDNVRRAARTAFSDGYAKLPLRFRSSSNAEDGEVVSGAGLHDSARGCFADDDDADTTGPSACLAPDERADLEAELLRRNAEFLAHPEKRWLGEMISDLSGDLTKERSVARALKKVFASLWNERAFEERAYYGIDQRTVFMAIAVHPSFVLEKVDAVAITNLPGASGPPFYRVVSQIPSIGVVRPVDPGAVAEVVTFSRGPDGKPTDIKTVTPSSLAPGPLWTDARLAELASKLFTVQDYFAAHTYPQRMPLSLDVEIKLDRNDVVVIKQARPYLSTGP
jgi:pyruvate, water dikinase